MILVTLDQNLELDVMQVISWSFVPTTNGNKFKKLSDTQYIIPNGEVPKDFYDNALDYFLDENKLRRLYL